MNHTCLFRYLLLLPLFVLSIAAKADERVEWCMRTNYNQDIPLRNVDYLMQADTLSSQFHIVLYGGEVVQNVRSLRFLQKPAPTAVQLPTQPSAKKPLPIIEGNQLRLSQLRSGVSVRILSVDGRELFRSVVTEQGVLSIDIARFPSGIYLLSTPGSTIKFLKP